MSHPAWLTNEEITHFKEWGYTALRNVIDRETVARAQATVRDHLATQGVYVDDNYRLDARPFTERPLAHADLVKGLKRNAAVRAMVTEAIHDVSRQIMTAFVGDADEPTSGFTDVTQLLFTWPNARTWSIPRSIWHLDFPRIPGDGFVGVQVFGFIEPVETHGGGTLIAAGSHRLVDEDRFVRSKDVKKALKAKPGYRDLLGKDEQLDRSRFLEPFEVDGIPQQVIEMTGEPGDVFLTDLRMLHTLAPNTSTRPRIMLTQRFIRRSAMDTLSDSSTADAA